MNGFSFLLIIILCLILTPLVLPVRFRGQAKFHGSLSWYGEISGFGGSVRLFFTKEDGSKARNGFRVLGWQKSIDSREPKPVTKKRKPGNGGFNVVLTRKTFNAVKDYLRKLVQCLNLEVRLCGEYGTDDPALTGFICGLIAVLADGLPNLHLNPNFMERSLEMEGEFKGRFYPIVILWHTVLFLLTSPIRSLWWPKLKVKNKLREVVSNA